jgi:hypothetical protein
MALPARTTRPWYSRIWTALRPPTALAAAQPRPRNGLLGWDGIPKRGGVIDHDHNPALQNGAWRGDSSTMGEGKRMYYEDAEFRAATNACIYPHMVNPWHMKPSDPDDPDARMVAGAAEDMFIKGQDWRKNQWDRFLCLRDGVRMQEIEVSYDSEFTAHAWTHEGDRVKRWVKQPTGRQGLYKIRLHPRLPHTVEEWRSNPDGTFGGILQTYRDDDTGSYDQAVIPAEKLLRWTCGEEGQNWEGDPVGRPAWSLCNLRRTMINDFGVMLYRFAYGSPGFEEIEANLDLDDEAMSRLDTIAREYAADPHQFIRTPYGVRFTIHEADLKNGGFFWQLYDGLGREIHRLFGTTHVFSGEGYGSRSEHDSKFDVHLLNLAHFGQLISDPFQPLLADWCEWNGWARRLAPTLEHDDLQTKSPKELAEFMKTAGDAGFLTGQTDDEVMLRKAGSLPDLTEDAIEGDGGGIAPAVDGAVQDTAYNGAQVSSAREIIADAAAGLIPKATARAMLVQFFRMSDDEADAILADIEVKPPDDTTPPGSPPNDRPGNTAPTDGPSEAGLSSCDCGSALADSLATNRLWKPHPGHDAACRHASQFGPVHALAEEFFDGASSRNGRERRIQSAAKGAGPIVERIAAKYAERLDGKTIGEAAKVKIKDGDLMELRRYLARQYKATARLGQDEVKREVKEQRDDPDFPGRLREAMAAAQGDDAFAFATIGDKAGKKGAAQEQWEQLDFDDYLSGVSRTTADAIAQAVQVSARNSVQGAAVQGGASAADIVGNVALDLTPRKLAWWIQPDVQGVYAKGRMVELARQSVPWGVYTNSPELSSEVCAECIDRAGDGDNPFEMSNAAMVGKFEAPNPDCLGGQNCWCVVIGLMQAPEDREQMRSDAVGEV